MATAGTAALTAGNTTVLFEPTDGGCTSFSVAVDGDAANGARVHVDGLHADGDWLPMAAGREITFRRTHGGIYRVSARGRGGNSTVFFGVVADTKRYQDG